MNNIFKSNEEKLKPINFYYDLYYVESNSKY